MKFCPTCQTRYDEEILRFCTKDGTALIEESEPSFAEIPVQKRAVDADDFGEETVVRRSAPQTEIAEQTQPLSPPPSAQRIVIPTSEPVKKAPPPVRAQTTTVYKTVPRAKSNTGKIVLLTLLGTFLILGSAGVLYMLTRERGDGGNANRNISVNANVYTLDTNLDTNLNANFNAGNASNFNVAGGFSNANANLNQNVKTPTPKPTPSAPSLSNVNNNIGIANPTPRPSVSPKPSASPTPIPSPSSATNTATPRPSPPAVPPPPPPPPSNRSSTTAIQAGAAAINRNPLSLNQRK